MNRFLQNYHEGRFSFGCLFMDRNVIAMSGLAKAGYDYVFIDLMYGWNTWDSVHHMIVAAQRVGLTAIVRVQSYPWRSDRTGTAADRNILVNASRAASLGADGVMVSVDNVADTLMLAEIRQDWHRAGDLQTSADELSAHETDLKDQLIIMPTIESLGALEQMEQIMDVEGVNALAVSGSDLPRQLGLAWQYEHPDVWSYVDRAVAMGKARGVAVGMNMGWIYTDITESVARVKRLKEHGLDFVLTQTDYHMLHAQAKSIVDGVNAGEANV